MPSVLSPMQDQRPGILPSETSHGRRNVSPRRRQKSGSPADSPRGHGVRRRLHAAQPATDTSRTRSVRPSSGRPSAEGPGSEPCPLRPQRRAGRPHSMTLDLNPLVGTDTGRPAVLTSLRSIGPRPLTEHRATAAAARTRSRPHHVPHPSLAPSRAPEPHHPTGSVEAPPTSGCPPRTVAGSRPWRRGASRCRGVFRHGGACPIRTGERHRA